MELKEFIKTAISDITEAVAELQAELNNGAIINPALNSETQGAVDTTQGIRMLERINFDIAVSTTSDTKKEGGAKAGISVLSAKIAAGKEEKSENISRISFSVPVLLPFSKVDLTKLVYGAAITR